MQSPIWHDMFALGVPFIEKSPADLLVDDGVVCEDALQRELITRLDLEAAAHKQGQELPARLDRLSAQVAALRS